MKTETKIIIGILASLTTAIGGIFIYKKLKISINKNEEKSNIDLNSDLKIDNNINFKPNLPITNNSKGVTVYVVQSALNSLGQNLEVNGEWNYETFQAVSEINGWGYGYNSICSFTKRCDFSVDNFRELISRATSVGFNYKNAVRDGLNYLK